MNEITRVGAPLPQSYEHAKQALAECAEIDECMDWADKAAALASYSKQANDQTMFNYATRIRARAIRRAGELLLDVEPAHGANQNITVADDSIVLTRTDAARDAGLSERQQAQAVRVARVPQEEFELAVEGENPATITKLAEMGTQKRNIVDLHGRDPAAYNRALHFVGLFWRFLRDVREREPLRAAVNDLDDDERETLRGHLFEIEEKLSTIREGLGP